MKMEGNPLRSRSQNARPVSTTGYVQQREGIFWVWGEDCASARRSTRKPNSTRLALPPNASHRSGLMGEALMGEACST